MLVTMFSTLCRFFSAPSSAILPLLSSADTVLLRAGLIGDLCISSILGLQQILKSSGQSSTDFTVYRDQQELKQMLVLFIIIIFKFEEMNGKLK